MRLVILTGASGSGKTAIADAIKVGHPKLADVLHFDSIGVPSPEAMVAGWGSGEDWQRASTSAWMTRIAAMSDQRRAVLFEGQMRLAFLRESVAAAAIADFSVMLIDCDDETRTRRLVSTRHQPDLANARMMNWAAHLRREAQESGCEILDTSQAPLEASVAHVRLRLAGA
jgi:RNase adaptor protein for sRNA GlmZ degradation